MDIRLHPMLSERIRIANMGQAAAGKDCLLDDETSPPLGDNWTDLEDRCRRTVRLSLEPARFSFALKRTLGSNWYFKRLHICRTKKMCFRTSESTSRTCGPS